MSNANSSCISHVSLGTNRFEDAREFYEEVLATIGCRLIMEHPGAAAFGREYPEFWIQTPHNGGPATVGNGVHVGFMATSRQQVDEFYKIALRAGATTEGSPGPRREYGEPYYGCFLRDLDGNKIEATFWDESLAKESAGD
jgi:catechol 2,3-dioxygenase-like lactoylglutathione lyase family enzyme